MSQEIKVTLDKFVPRSYQLPLITAIESGKFKRVVAVLPRRAGKDVAAFNVMFRMALRRVGVYYYIFPTFTQAKRVIWQSILNDGSKFLDFIPKELVQQKNESELRINLKNGSVIQLVGSDNYDGLVGTNPCGLVFSEYALQDPRAYQFLRPILAANDGWAVFISCVSPDTVVITDKGMKRIKDVCSSRVRYTDINVPIYGLGGFHTAEQFYHGRKQKTLKITLATGFQIECTPIHPLWNGREWIKAEDLTVGDKLPIQYGQGIFSSGITAQHITDCEKDYAEITKLLEHPQFFYALGIIYSSGIYKDGEITVDSYYQETTKPFRSLGFNGRSPHIDSPIWKTILQSLGYLQEKKHIPFPEVFFYATRTQISQFIQGLFDADIATHENTREDGEVSLSHENQQFVKDLQIILLNFGIVSRVSKTSPYSAHTKFNLSVSAYFAGVFYETIGFRIPHKQARQKFISRFLKRESGNSYPLDHKRLEALGLKFYRNSLRRRTIAELNEISPNEYFSELLAEKFYYSPIKSIEPSMSEVFDFVIPETHSFFSNGFVSHNTPRGKNHFYDLFQIAKESPDWFAYRMTLDDTKHISMEEIEREKRDGLMSEDLILQEYFCSFDLGIEGSYYGKYMDKMRLEQRIGEVPWDPSSLVYTAWDLGVRDLTCIIFFQTIGQTVRIIDCYENSKFGLEHYVKEVINKPYAYGKHIAPHDIKVQEFGSGLTRIEKARQLGIKFTIAPDLSIEDGIEAVRSTLPRVWIDSKCQSVIKALDNYRQEYDPKKKTYKQHPLHDIHSHMADAFRYLSISLPRLRLSTTPEELERRYHEAVYGNNSQLPPFFRD